MSFADSLRDVAKRASVAQSSAQTEEATKTACVMPFLKALGYDVFDLNQVVPEFTADVGVKKGEKVDYALKINGDIAVLIEAKAISTDLSDVQFNQLYRYFNVTNARIAVLTNGREYRFFTDIDEPNKMDKRPFFVFDLEAFDDADVRELAKFHHDRFDIDNILSTAATLKYTHAAASYLRAQLDEPDDDFVKLVGRQIYDGNMTKPVVEQLRPTVRSAFEQIIRDRIQDRINKAFSSEEAQPQASETESQSGGASDDSGAEKEIVTTAAEWEGFYIVRAIGAEVVDDPERIAIRDQKTYCGILFDDNNRKPICRLHFNGKTRWYVGLFDENRNETRHRVSRPVDIYKFKNLIQSSVKSLMN